MKHLEDLQQEDEYINRKFVYHLEVKNNICIPTKFYGTQSEFEIKYKDYFSYDTFGKIIGFHKNEYIHKEEVVKKEVKRNRWGEDISEGGLNRSNTNKRYWKYL